MGASAGDFLDHLEQAGLLDPDTLKPLWKQVARQPDLTAEHLAATLVEGGQLTQFQSKNALKAIGISAGGDAPAAKAPSAPEKIAPVATTPAPSAPSAAKPAAEEPAAGPTDRAALLAAKYLSRGGAAPAAKAPAAPKAPASDDLDLDLAPLDDEPKKHGGGTPVAKSPTSSTPASTPQKAAPQKTPQKTAAAPGAGTPAQKPTDKGPAKSAPAAPAPAASSGTPGAAQKPATQKPAAGTPAAKSEGTKGPAQKSAAPANAANIQKSAKPTSTVPMIEELPTLEPVAELEPLASVDDLAALESLTGVPDELTPLLTGNAQLVDAPPVAPSPLDLAALEVDPLSMAPPSAMLLAAKQKRGPWWKSPLYLSFAGVGALTGLLVLWILAGWMRGSPDVILANAEELYAAQSYTDAAGRYASFVWRFPRDERTGHARVRQGLAQIQAAAATSEGDWTPVLESAQQELPGMFESAEFSESHAELAKLLPQMAEGLVKQAEASGNDRAAQDALVAQATEAVALLDDGEYWPEPWRRGVTTTRANLAEKLDDLQRDAARDRALGTALEKIQAAVKEGKAADVYAQRQALVRAYPTLAAHGLLKELLTSTAKGLREQTKPQSEALPAAAAVTKPLATVVFSARYGEAAIVPATERAFVSVAGAAYALEASSGRVLWRRDAGAEAPPPVAIAKAAGDSDALVWIPRTNELVRYAGDDGKELWRAALGEPCAAPIVSGQRVLVAARSGKLWALDGASGQVAAGMSFPQELAQSPAVETITAAPVAGAEAAPAAAKPGRVIQLAEHSNVYVLANDLSACQEVVYLGQGAGSVAVPPVAVQGCILVPENISPNECLLHVLAGSETGPLKKTQKPIPLVGRVLTPMAALPHGAVVTTDRGAIYMFAADATNEHAPVKVISQLTPEVSALAPTPPLVTAVDEHVWLAGDGLARYGLLPGKDQMPRRWAKFAGESFLATPQKIGDVLITVRERPGSSGASVAAMRVDASGTGVGDADTIWETRLGVAPAGSLVTSQGQPPVFAATADGNILPVDKAALEQGRAELVLAKAPSSAARLEHGAVTTSGWAWSDGAALNRIHGFDLGAAKEGVRAWDLLLGDELGGDLAAFGPGVLVPCASGRVELRNPLTGAALAQPFQPRAEPGVKVAWARPAAGEGGTEFVIADNRRQLYRVGVEKTPQPFLKQLAVAETSGVPCGPVAVLGGTALVATRGETNDELTPYSVADLKAGAATTLAARAAFGPERVGDVAVVGLESGALVWYRAAADNSLKETAANEAVGMVAGPPALVGTTDMLVASADGRVRRFALASGEIVGSVDMGSPLGSGPVVLGSRMFVFGRDGTLYFGNVPAK